MKKLLFFSLITLLSLALQAQTIEITQDTTRLASKTGRFRDAYVNGVRYTKGATGNAEIIGTKVFRTLSELRRFTNPVAGIQYWVAEKGKRGYFEVDPSDNLTLDDNLNTIVAGNKRIKRVNEYSVDQLTIRQSQAQLAIQGQNSVLEAFQGMASADGTKTYTTIGNTFTGAGSSGGSVNTAAGTITVASGQKGTGSYLEQSFAVAAYPDWKAGDRITVRLIVKESVTNLIQPNLVTSLSVANQSIPIETQSVVTGSQTIAITFDYVVAAPSDVLKIRLTLDASSPVLSAAGTYTWQSTSIANNVTQLKSFASQVKAVTQTIPLIQTTTYNGPLYPQWYGAMGDGVADDTQALQNVINAAANGSKMVYISEGKYRITSALVVSEGITIYGPGTFYVDRDGELFKLTTAASCLFRDFKVERINAKDAKFIAFDSATTNVGTRIEYLKFKQMPVAVEVNYVKNLTIRRCSFEAGLVGVVIAASSPQSVKNLSIQECSFEGQSDISLFVKGGSDLLIEGNTFYPTAILVGNCIQFEPEPNAGSFTGWSVRNNRLYAYRNSGVTISVRSGINVTNTAISDNVFTSTQANFDLVINGESGNVSGVAVLGNLIKNQGTACYLRKSISTVFAGNIFQGMGSLSKAFDFDSGCTYTKSANIYTGQAVTNSINNSTLLTDQ